MIRLTDPVIEELLGRASARWRRIRFLMQSAILGTVTLIALLLLGVGMMTGWFSSPLWVTICLVLIVLISGFAWLLVGVITSSATENRPWLAASVECRHRPLLDRLNTLVFLQQQRAHQSEVCTDPASLEIEQQIEQQTRQVLIRQPPPVPFSLTRVVAHFAMFTALLTATVLFYGYFQPWRQLMAASHSPENLPARQNLLIEIPPLGEIDGPLLQEEEAPWAEIRITQPGRSLRATTLDIVPLRIEAASNRTLRRVEWLMTVNGQAEIQHKLSPPEDPLYAVYELELRLEDHQVEAWDVISYFARATTEDDHISESDVYFIEVLPFREELEDLPGGLEGPGYKMLEQLTAMIRLQQEVLRQTHRQEQAADQPQATWQQRNQRLAQEEAGLSRATEHMAAEVTSRYEAAPTDELIDHLQRSGSTLKEAEKALFDNDLSEAQQRERNALSQLIATRKHFQHLLNTNAEAFQPSSEDSPGNPPNLVEEPASEQVEQAQQQQKELDEQLDQQRRMAATEEQLESTRRFIQQMLQKQRDLERRANPQSPNNLPKLAEQQRQLRRSLQEFSDKHPESFQRSQKECSDAQSAMQQAAKFMENKNARAQQQAGLAGDKLRKLDDSLQQQQLFNRLADAHRLRQMLEEQILQLKQCQQQGASSGQCRKLAQQAKSTTDQLKQIAEQKPTSSRFGPQLGEALSDKQKQQLDAQADQLAQTKDRSEQKQASGELRKGLQKVAHAFDASCSNPTGSNGQNGQLQAAGQQAITQGIQSLRSSALGRSSGRRSTQQDQARLGREATANLQAGVLGVYGHNDRSQQVLNKLEQDLREPDFLLNLQTIEALMQDIQQLGREVAVDVAPETEQAESLQLDTSQLPPTYRKSIEKYFKKLSER